MTAVLKYNDFFLYEWGKGWKSDINGEWMIFDTVSQWKDYIDLIKRK